MEEEEVQAKEFYSKLLRSLQALKATQSKRQTLKTQLEAVNRRVKSIQDDVTQLQAQVRVY